MIPVKKIEIIIDEFELPSLLNLLDQAGVSGYTVIKDATGKGDRGVRSGGDLTRVFANSYVLTVCPEDKLDLIVETIRPILKQRGGVCLVSEAQWLIH
ncbi:MAG TPA: P-II family nitrogen regulator [Pyrinomonadaceae bacterium]|nr:P-II family nitrogen regulator [Pyrinomonadaceae bacterium]